MSRSVLGYQRTVMMRVRPLLILLVSHLAVRGDTNVSENSRLQAAVALERMYAKVSELEKRVVAQAAEIEQLTSRWRGLSSHTSPISDDAPRHPIALSFRVPQQSPFGS